MKVIVTGGAGFLGSHLCDLLVSKGDEVICIDNLITGDLQNIHELENHPKFKFIKIDVSKDLPDLGVDQIYHLASPASPNLENPKSYRRLSFETMLVNSVGTWNLVDLAIKTHAKFLLASTSEIYGNPLEHPQNEEYNGNVSPIGPRSVYDESKRFGETIVAEFIRKKGLDGRIVRIFNTYGPRMPDDGRVVIEFISAALKKQPIRVFGDGRQTRSFCYVSDLVEGLYLAMNQENTKGEVFNLGNPQEFMIRDLAMKVKEKTHSDSEIVFQDALPEDDPLKRRPDISKAEKVLSWRPIVPIDSGLEQTIEFFKAKND